jgi:tetratricopeptide (TPR) repeat protein
VIDPRGTLCYSLPVAAKVGKIGKELKAPDQFVSFWGEVGKKANAHKRELLIALAGVVALVLIAWVSQVVMGGRAEEATQGFARINRVISTPIAAEGAPAPTDGSPTFKTERERAEAALKEADAFLASHSGSRLRDEVQLVRARLLLGLGRAPEALALYNNLVNEVDDSLAFVADEGLAYAQEAAGQVDAAIATLDKLAEKSKNAGNFFRDRALFNKGRLLEGKGAKKDAEAVYRSILAEVPTTSLKEDINHRLAILETK